MDLVSKFLKILDSKRKSSSKHSAYTGIDSHKWSSKITTMQRLSGKPAATLPTKAKPSETRLSK